MQDAGLSTIRWTLGASIEYSAANDGVGVGTVLSSVDFQEKESISFTIRNHSRKQAILSPHLRRTCTTPPPTCKNLLTAPTVDRIYL